MDSFRYYLVRCSHVQFSSFHLYPCKMQNVEELELIAIQTRQQNLIVYDVRRYVIGYKFTRCDSPCDSYYFSDQRRNRHAKFDWPCSMITSWAEKPPTWSSYAQSGIWMVLIQSYVLNTIYVYVSVPDSRAIFSQMFTSEFRPNMIF